MFGFRLLSASRWLPWFNALFIFRLYWVFAIMYFSQVTGSFVLAGSLFALIQLSQAIFEVPTGIFSDLVGRKKSLVLGSVASLLSVLLYASGHSYAWLALGAVLDGCWRALFSGNNDALLYESLKEEKRAHEFDRVLGRLNSNGELAGFVSTVLGGTLVMLPLAYLFWITLIPQVISLVLALLIRAPHQDHATQGNIFKHLKGAWELYRNSQALRWLSGTGVLGFGVGDALWSYQSVLYQVWLPQWLIGGVLSLNFLLSFVSFRVGWRLLKRWPAATVVFWQEVYARGLYWLALVIPSLASPFIIATSSAGYGAAEVAKKTMMQELLTDRQRATLVSMNSLLGSGLNAVCLIGVGWLVDQLGVVQGLLIAQSGLWVVVLCYVKLKKITETAHLVG